MHLRRFVPAVLLAATITLPAHAVSKEMVQLMTQVQQLQDAVARLQQSNDERMGVMKDLVQQTADSVNRMSVTVGNLQQSVSKQNAEAAGKVDQLSGQIQSLNDTLDELQVNKMNLIFFTTPYGGGVRTWTRPRVESDSRSYVGQSTWVRPSLRRWAHNRRLSSRANVAPTT